MSNEERKPNTAGLFSPNRKQHSDAFKVHNLIGDFVSANDINLENNPGRSGASPK